MELILREIRTIFWRGWLEVLLQLGFVRLFTDIFVDLSVSELSRKNTIAQGQTKGSIVNKHNGFKKVYLTEVKDLLKSPLRGLEWDVYFVVRTDQEVHMEN